MTPNIMKYYCKPWLLVILLFALLGCNQSKNKAPNKVTEAVGTDTSTFAKSEKKEPELLKPGSKAPDFSLPATDGKTYSLGDFDHFDYLVVLFTCNHCPTAQAYEDKFIKIVSDYDSKGVGFVAISPNDPEAISLSELGYSDMSDTMDEMKLRVAQKKYNFPYLYDGDTQTTALAYGPAATPHAFVFDQKRILKYSGRIDDTENPYVKPATPDLRNVLNALISGTDSPVTQTKTFGCSIKWSWKGDWAKKQLAEWSKEPVNLEEIDLKEVENLCENTSDKLRLINLWATWCGPCIIEFPELVSINRMYRDRDFEFVSLSTDKIEKKEKALSILKKKEATNTNYIYSGTDIYELIEVVDKDWQGALPYTALIAPGGNVLYKVQGTFDPPALKMAIVEHLGRYYADND